ncbi:cytidine deaminase-like [Ciona intestinalis]
MSKNSPKELLEMAREAKKFAYNPYSKFRVGAALVTKEGRIFTGCNVENVGFTSTICAERTAICKAVSEGYRDFVEIAVTSDLKDEIVTPCGVCRQTLSEFGSNIKVYCSKSDLCFEEFTLKELLPRAFENNHLESFQATVKNTLA